MEHLLRGRENQIQTTLLTAKSFSFKLEMIMPTWQTTSPWSIHNVLIRAAIKEFDSMIGSIQQIS